MIVHVLNHASRLSVDRGCLVCTTADEKQRRAPLDDIETVVIAARGVHFSADCIRALLSRKAIILHCDENYRPVGKSAGLNYVLHQETFERQINMPQAFASELWHKLLHAKIENQAFVLDAIGADHKLHQYLADNNTDEGNTARHYWGYYFKRFGSANPGTRERKGAADPVNGMLNYGYAVMGALVHRAILAHGLNPVLGVHHLHRFKSDPLVYDLMEPLRPLCDFMLLRFRKENPDKKIDEWVKFAAANLVASRLKDAAGKKISLVLAIDRFVSSVENSYRNGGFKLLYVPALKGINFEAEETE